MIKKIKIAYYKYKFDDLSDKISRRLIGLEATSASDFHKLKEEYLRVFNILKNLNIPLYPISDAIRVVGCYGKTWPSFKAKYSIDEVERRNSQEFQFLKNGSFELKK